MGIFRRRVSPNEDSYGDDRTYNVVSKQAQTSCILFRQDIRWQKLVVWTGRSFSFSKSPGEELFVSAGEEEECMAQDPAGPPQDSRRTQGRGCGVRPSLQASIPCMCYTAMILALSFYVDISAGRGREAKGRRSGTKGGAARCLRV